MVALCARVVLKCAPKSRKLLVTRMVWLMAGHLYLRRCLRVVRHVEKVADLAGASLAPISMRYVCVFIGSDEVFFVAGPVGVYHDVVS